MGSEGSGLGTLRPPQSGAPGATDPETTGEVTVTHKGPGMCHPEAVHGWSHLSLEGVTGQGQSHRLISCLWLWQSQARPDQMQYLGAEG